MDATVGSALGNLHPVIALLIALPCIVVVALWRRMERRDEAFTAREAANMDRFIAMHERSLAAINNNSAAVDKLTETIAENAHRP